MSYRLRTAADYFDAAGRQIQSSFQNTYSQYVWGLAYVNDVILRDRNADGSMSTGNLGISGSGLEEREYAQHDSQFSVISLTSRTGNVIQRLAYDPYGKMTTLTATWTYDSTGGGTNYWFVLFQGMMYVADGSGGNLLQSDTRLYDVSLGRWTSEDRARYFDGPNMYQLDDSNPTDELDALGLVGAGAHHGYPQYLGGAQKQPLFKLNAAKHTAAHRYFTDRGFAGPSCSKLENDFGRAKWQQLTEAEQQEMIEESLRAAGVPDAWIAENIEGMMANATPGVVQAGGSKALPIGPIAGALVIVLTSETALADEDINSASFINP